MRCKCFDFATCSLISSFEKPTGVFIRVIQNFSLRGKNKYVIYRLGRSVLEKYFPSVSFTCCPSGLIIYERDEFHDFLGSTSSQSYFFAWQIA